MCMSLVRTPYFAAIHIQYIPDRVPGHSVPES